MVDAYYIGYAGSTSEVIVFRKLMTFFRYLYHIDNIGWFQGFVALGLLYMLLKRVLLKYGRIATELIVLGIFFILFVSISECRGEDLSSGGGPMRVILTVLPFLVVLTALFLFFVYTKNQHLAYLLLFTLLFTNLLCISPAHEKPRSYLMDYITEIHNDYTTPYEAASSFLRENAKQDDKIVAYTGYMNWPLQFYVGDKIKICCILDNETKLPRSKLDQLNAPLFIEEDSPDWIISFGGQYEVNHILGINFRKGVEYELNTTLNIFWQDRTRPDLLYEVGSHHFGPVEDFDPAYEAIYLLKKKDEGV